VAAVGGSGGTPNLKDALRHARDLGAVITYPRGTGEVKVEFQGLGSVRCNNRRKDASRALIVLIRTAERRRLH